MVGRSQRLPKVSGSIWGDDGRGGSVKIRDLPFLCRTPRALLPPQETGTEKRVRGLVEKGLRRWCRGREDLNRSRNEGRQKKDQRGRLGKQAGRRVGVTGQDREQYRETHAN